MLQGCPKAEIQLGYVDCGSKNVEEADALEKKNKW